MEKEERAVLCTIIIGVAAGLAVSYALTASADPGYPYETVTTETVEPIDISKITPISIESETEESVIEAVIVEESAPFEPTTAAPTEPETEPQPVIEETTIAETEPPTPKMEVYLTDEERQLMAQLVHSEVGTEGFDVKRYVVDVVFNRVDSPLFPNTITEVIYQKRQFSVVANGAFDRAAYELTEDDWLAVDQECYGRLDYGILYFNATSMGYCANGKNGWKIEHVWFAY